MTAQSIVDLAKQYIGIEEKYNNNVMFNTAYYGRAVNGSQYPWCAVFIWYVFKAAGAPELYYGGGKTAYCPTLATYYRRHNQWSGTPQVGDIVFYNFSRGTTPTHVGIVSEVAGTYIKAIEGNTSGDNQTNGGMVMERARSLSVCIGFARPNYSGSVEETQGATMPTQTTVTRPSYTVGQTYTLQVELKVRKGPGTQYQAKTHAQLTASGQKHDADKDGALDKGTRVTCLAVKTVGSDVWIQCPSGWLAAYYGGKTYIK